MTKHKTVNLVDDLTANHKLKILVIGAEGDIGRAVCAELSPRHDIIKAGRNSGDVHADMTDRASIKAMYQQVGRVDAVVSAAGAVHFANLTDYTEEQLMLGLKNKLMGQVNLVLAGMDYVNDGGSFTLTSGVLNRDPIKMGVGAATANGALDSFVFAAAVEMPRSQRINIVSPGLLDVSVDKFGSFFPGHEPVSSHRVGLAYARSVEGVVTGKVILVD